MKPVSRRSVMAGSAAVVAAVPVVASLASAAPVVVGEDRLLNLVREFERELAAIDSIEDPTERQINAWQRKARVILKEATKQSVTAASAVAILDLILREDLLEPYSLFGEHYEALAVGVRNYLAGGVA